MTDKQEVLDVLNSRFPHPLVIISSVEHQLDLNTRLLLALLSRQTDLTVEEQELVDYANQFMKYKSVDFETMGAVDTSKLDGAVQLKGYTRALQSLYYNWLREKGLL
jgi:hypothetical protein